MFQLPVRGLSVFLFISAGVTQLLGRIKKVHDKHYPQRTLGLISAELLDSFVLGSDIDALFYSTLASNF